MSDFLFTIFDLRRKNSAIYDIRRGISHLRSEIVNRKSDIFALADFFVAILSAFGITQVKRRNKRYFVPHLIFIFIIIIGWNWFKLAGRGLRLRSA